MRILKPTRQLRRQGDKKSRSQKETFFGRSWGREFKKVHPLIEPARDRWRISQPGNFFLGSIIVRGVEIVVVNCG